MTKSINNTRVSNKYLNINKEKSKTCSMAWRGDG